MPKLRGLRATNSPDSIGQVDSYSHESTAAAIARLSAQVERQARAIRGYETAIRRSRDVFERASAAAHLGLWECDLATEALQWSGGTYDMFAIPRDRPLKREQTLVRYPTESLKTLDDIRRRAIAERSSFNLDTEIVTPAEGRRWIRITATVECTADRATRLLGFKQDITEERVRWERTRRLADFDALTGLANRSQFQAGLSEACGDDGGPAAGGILLLVDLDGFKEVNDSLGHTASDECLKEAARRLATVCNEAKIVARIGGDEFAVLLGPSEKVGSPGLLAKQVVATMGRTIRYEWRRFRVGASIGLATLRGCRSDEALKRADAALYAAKAAGRNTFRWFVPGEMRL
jgi:diguanylate cyclase (GGDEF)-like protein